MAHQPIKLAEPQTGYSVFEDNQVLTAEQLNSIAHYLDYNDRLTRTCLVGVGVVCGLQVQLTEEEIRVSRGTGVTTDGDLLYLDADRRFNALLPFDDADAKYPLFTDLVANKRLWQLVGADNTDNSRIPVSQFFGESTPPQQFIVLLYVSQFVKETDVCSTDDCDNKGDLATNHLRLLVMDRNDFDRLVAQSPCNDELYFNMPELAVPRVLLNEADNVFSYGDLLTAYRTAINASLALMTEPLKVATETAVVLVRCYQAGGHFSTGDNNRMSVGDMSRLGTIDFGVTGTFATKVTQVINAGAANAGIQYLYDFVKEVAEAYREFKEAVFDLCYGCCLPPSLFPKHLALGLFFSSETERCRYRNCFIESPLLHGGEEKMQMALQLFTRLTTLISSFNFPAVDEIRITPSAGIEAEMGKRAIPFYYDSASIVSAWDPEKTKRRRTNTHLSYHAASPNSYTNLPHIRQPLGFDIDKYPFFRIEGHVGKEFGAALRDITRLRNQFDLPFEIVGVQLQRERLTIFPTFPVRPGLFDLLFDKERIRFNTKLDHLTNYTNNVNEKLPDDNELAGDGVKGDALQLKKTLRTRITDLGTHVANTKLALARPAADVMGQVDWSALHENIANAGAEVNKHAKEFTAAGSRAPIEHTAILEHPILLDWLSQIKINRDDKVKDGFVFSNFIRQNQSLLHNGGVCRGGTFILLYNTVNNVRTVVADFYLPYIAKAELVDSTVDHTTVPVKPIRTINYFVEKDIVKRPVLNKDLFDLKTQVSAVDQLTKESDIFVRQKVNEFGDRIIKTGDDVRGAEKRFTDGLLSVNDTFNKTASALGQQVTSVSRQVADVTGSVTQKLLEVNDVVQKNSGALAGQIEGVKKSYESSFNNLISAYNTVVTKTTIPSKLTAADHIRELASLKPEELAELKLNPNELNVLNPILTRFRRLP